ncbi:11390_t:CDS:2 [Dentiscutata heterogama]|uniref:11390_t:CDS:1 n=1 Tax=Dentiscutata heterogama TaxID=1316150 RepID=A0ACA9K059_9GLOM|nr:11390_t:CDS:2 [Dentiscutata heterogama]
MPYWITKQIFCILRKGNLKSILKGILFLFLLSRREIIFSFNNVPNSLHSNTQTIIIMSN